MWTPRNWTRLPRKWCLSTWKGCGRGDKLSMNWKHTLCHQWKSKNQSSNFCWSIINQLQWSLTAKTSNPTLETKLPIVPYFSTKKSIWICLLKKFHTISCEKNKVVILVIYCFPLQFAVFTLLWCSLIFYGQPCYFNALNYPGLVLE
jgi:hypothetical protein